MGRRQTWKVRKATASEKKRMKEFILRISEEESTLFKQYCNFVTKNNMVIGTRSVILFGITLQNQGLAGGTVGTYLRRIVGTIRCAVSITTKEKDVRHMRTFVEKFITTVPSVTTSAPPISRRSAEGLVKKIENPFIRFTAELMLCAPLRPGDIAKLQWSHLHLDASNLHIKVCGGKTWHLMQNRERITVSRNRLSLWLENFVSKGGQGRITGCTATQLTHKLRELSRQPVSSYSLRHLLIRELVESTRQGGVIDWERAMTLTLHRNIKSLKAHYMYNV